MLIEPDNIRILITRWRNAANALSENNPQWSSHFYDCANELSRAIEKDEDDARHEAEYLKHGQDAAGLGSYHEDGP